MKGTNDETMVFGIISESPRLQGEASEGIFINISYLLSTSKR